MSEIPLRATMPDFTWQVYHEAAILKIAARPDEVTQRLGLTPTSTLQPGHPVVSGHSLASRVAGWIIETPERQFNTTSFNQEGLSDLTALVRQFHDRLHVIQSLCPPAELRFKTIIATNSPNPGCGLSLDMTRMVVELSATWEVSFWTSLAA